MVPDASDEIFRSWLPAILRCFSTPGARHQKQIRIVDSCGDVFSDPGANPGASITHFARAGPFDIPALAARSRRLRRFPPALACSSPFALVSNLLADATKGRLDCDLKTTQQLNS